MAFAISIIVGVEDATHEIEPDEERDDRGHGGEDEPEPSLAVETEDLVAAFSSQADHGMQTSGWVWERNGLRPRGQTTAAEKLGKSRGVGSFESNLSPGFPPRCRRGVGRHSRWYG